MARPEAEKTLAIYPIIVVPDTMADGRYLGVSPHGDGETILDFLHYPFVTGIAGPGLVARYNRYGETIRQRLQEFATPQDPKTEHIRRKYVWFAHYFNRVVTEHRSSCPGLLPIAIQE